LCVGGWVYVCGCVGVCGCGLKVLLDTTLKLHSSSEKVEAATLISPIDVLLFSLLEEFYGT